MSRNFELLKQLETKADVKGTSRVFAEVVRTTSTGAGEGELVGPEIASLAQTVFLGTSTRATRKVVFCGVDRDKGSSVVCAGVGRALSSLSDKSVCLIDANLREHRLSGMFALRKQKAFSSSSSVSDLCTLVAGSLWLAQPELLEDKHGALLPAIELKSRMAQLEADFDILLVDAPGLAVSREAVALGEIVGSAILIIEANTTRRLAARRAKESLESAGVKLLGTVLHNRSFPIPKGFLSKL